MNSNRLRIEVAFGLTLGLLASACGGGDEVAETEVQTQGGPTGGTEPGPETGTGDPPTPTSGGTGEDTGSTSDIVNRLPFLILVIALIGFVIGARRQQPALLDAVTSDPATGTHEYR